MTDLLTPQEREISDIVEGILGEAIEISRSEYPEDVLRDKLYSLKQRTLPQILAKLLKHRSPELRFKANDLLVNCPTYFDNDQLEAALDVFDQLLLLYPDEEEIKRAERERLQPFLEDSIEILTNAQGEWASVTDTYSPEWTHRLKEVCGLIALALKGQR